MKLFAKFFLVIYILLTNNFVLAQIKSYNQSASHFSNPPSIDNSKGIYSTKEMYRAFRQGATSFASLRRIQERLERDIRKFADKKGRGFVILGSRPSNPPYILGNYPAIEIIFVLVDRE